MDLIPWNESHSVHIALLDQQHKKLVSLINELYQGAEQGQSREDLRRIMAGLLDYAMNHFDAEEELMSTHGFPGLEEHRKEHQEFRHRITQYSDQFLDIRGNVALPLSYYLIGWLLTHVFLTDKKYSAFLNARGVH